VSISTNDLKNGMALQPPGGADVGRRIPARQAGKGGRLVRTKMKKCAAVPGSTASSGVDEKVKLAVIDKREMQLPYREEWRLRLHGNELRTAPTWSRRTVGNAV